MTWMIYPMICILNDIKSCMPTKYRVLHVPVVDSRPLEQAHLKSQISNPKSRWKCLHQIIQLACLQLFLQYPPILIHWERCDMPCEAYLILHWNRDAAAAPRPQSLSSSTEVPSCIYSGILFLTIFVGVPHQLHYLPCYSDQKKQAS